MPPTVIENPVINSPFAAPTRHFRFAEGTITSDDVAGRRVSEYFVPVPAPKIRGKAGASRLTLDMASPPERREENKEINEIRAAVASWRGRGYPFITTTTRMLLDY